ncbi:MAG: endonuclease domain-containing protein [Parcubacteria group bacterium]|jgi:very-short-patch-repair endonuclease
MTKIYNKAKIKENRRLLRKVQTKEELIFWAQVKNRRFHDYKFRRQYSIGNYIADFYCPELKLVVEIDGGQHYEKENIKKDFERTKFFEDLGMKIKRYTNIEIKNNLSGVMEELWGGLK